LLAVNVGVEQTQDLSRLQLAKSLFS
jgi:hypothetical protein